MAVTPETLPRHELVGLDVEVVSASNPDLVGIGGVVVAETTATLGIERTDAGGEARVSRVPKADATFAFTLPDDGRGDDDDPGGERVTVEGEVLVARPARRTEDAGDSQWR